METNNIKQTIWNDQLQPQVQTQPQPIQTEVLNRNPNSELENIVTLQDAERVNNGHLSMIKQEVASNPAIQEIARALDITDTKKISKFGQDTAIEISKFGDKVLSTINNKTVEDSGELLLQLDKVMSKFDVKDFEITEERKGFLAKIFGKVSSSIDELFDKYKTMDTEVSKVFTEIQKYQKEIGNTNDMLDNMYEKNLEYFRELELHIQAGHLVINQLKNVVIPKYEALLVSSNQDVDRFNLQDMKEKLEMMQQRVYDLELARMVTIQTAPQIRLIQRSNYNLLRKIDNAFIITMPAFKTGIIQAITVKRQKIQADAMKALDDRTNEMLIRNAQNISNQSIEITKLAGGSSIKLDTLEQAFAAIVNGIEETRKIEEENRIQREQGRERLEKLQQDVIGKLMSPDYQIGSVSSTSNKLITNPTPHTTVQTYNTSGGKSAWDI